MRRRGLTPSLRERVSSTNSSTPRQYRYTWSQSSGNAFISQRQTQWDGNLSTYETTTIDSCGNILTRNVFDSTNSSTRLLHLPEWRAL